MQDRWVTLPRAAVDALLGSARRLIDEGRLPSCQLAVARDGEVLLSETFGEAAPGDRYSVMSVTKAVLAATTWLVLSDGVLQADTRAADLVPELDRDGLSEVTLAHLLTHTAGFPRAPMRPHEGATSAGRRARFATWRQDWPAGSRTEYHPVSAHWVVAELLESVTGTDYRTLVRTRLLDPLGLSTLQLGVPPSWQADVRDLVPVGEGRAGSTAPVVASEQEVLLYNDPAVRAVGVPGAGAVSTAADVALLYQGLLHDRAGLFDPAVLADGTGHVRNTMTDPWTQVPANRTLGLLVAGDDGRSAMRELGTGVGPRAFGGSGLGGQIAWADPGSGLSFCFLTDGVERDVVRTFVRSDRLSTLAAEL